MNAPVDFDRAHCCVSALSLSAVATRSLFGKSIVARGASGVYREDLSTVTRRLVLLEPPDLAALRETQEKPNVIAHVQGLLGLQNQFKPGRTSSPQVVSRRPDEAGSAATAAMAGPGISALSSVARFLSRSQPNGFAVPETRMPVLEHLVPRRTD